MSTTLLLSFTAWLSALVKVHASDMMHLHPQCCETVESLTDMFAEKDNPFTDTSDVHNREM